MALVRPWAEDASGNDANLFQNVSMSWSSTGTHAGTATVSIAKNWVSNPRCPTGRQITDCHLSSGGPNNYLCSQTSVKVGTQTTDIRRTLLQFDVSSIPGALSSWTPTPACNRPDGWNIGWNVGQVGGQSVDHAHCHLIPRYRGELHAGKGLRWQFKQQENEPAARQ